jgi:cytochrome c6
MKRIKLAGTFAVAMVIVVGAAGPASAGADGAAVYAKQCASCHGPDGKGATPAGKALQVKDLVVPRWAAPEAISAIEKAVREGVPRMPALAAKLTPEEIAAVARYAQQMVAAASPKP